MAPVAVTPVEVAPGVVLGAAPLVLIAGPCVIESRDHALTLGGQIAEIARQAGVPYVFKASFDKANRTSFHSFRGPGLDAGLETLAAVRRLPAAAGDPRIDLQEAEAASALGDFTRESAALVRTAAAAEQIGARGLLARARLLEGRTFYNQGKPEATLAALHEARQLFEEVGDRAGAASTLNSLGTVLSDQRDVATGVAMYEASLRQSEEIGDRKSMSAALNNLGILFKDMRRYADALKAHERALALRREINERNWMAISLSNIGVVYFEQDRFGAAEQYYRESLAVAREVGDKHGIVRAHHNLAIVSRETGQMVKAQAALEESLALRREIGDRRGQSDTAQIGVDRLKPRHRQVEQVAALLGGRGMNFIDDQHLARKPQQAQRLMAKRQPPHQRLVDGAYPHIGQQRFLVRVG